MDFSQVYRCNISSVAAIRWFLPIINDEMPIISPGFRVKD
jgi:hypothetical protein